MERSNKRPGSSTREIAIKSRWRRRGVPQRRVFAYLAVMALHMIKLCVGIDSVEALEAHGRATLKRDGCWKVWTRRTPVQADALADGGSLYRVIKGAILCRQPILRVDTVGQGRESRCQITVGHEVICVEPTPRRPFQGWRYLKLHEAPADLDADGGAVPIPLELTLKLRELGAW